LILVRNRHSLVSPQNATIHGESGESFQILCSALFETKIGLISWRFESSRALKSLLLYWQTKSLSRSLLAKQSLLGRSQGRYPLGDVFGPEHRLIGVFLVRL
jgi:hypothetical protein